MTKIIASLISKSLRGMAEQAVRAFADGADWVELRLDHLDSTVAAAEVSAFLQTLPPARWLITLRSAEEGGLSQAPLIERLFYLYQAINGRAGAMDVEYRPWRALAKSNPAQLEPVFENPPVTAMRLILSRHDFQGRPGDVSAVFNEVLSVHPNVTAKLAWRGEALIDNVEALAAMRAADRRGILIVMGEVGLASRVLAKKFGAAATYCALEKGAEAAPGQVSLEQMRTLYRWDAISKTTRVFGVLGDPVAHSLSPRLFNGLFDADGIDAVYLPFFAPGGEPRLIEFLQACESSPWLDVGGFSVTLPHKESARRFVGDRVDPQSARIGAVNTLVLRDSRFHGFNTDYAGALAALCGGLRCSLHDLRGLPVDVLGAGGVARAVIAALADCGARVVVFNRDSRRAAPLATEFGCEAAPWEARAAGAGRVLVNCTSVGLFPHEVGTPMPPGGLAKRELVFDTIYNPLDTRLLREARDAGCATVSGVDMFVNQAAAQYEIWFGGKPDLAGMRATALAALACGSEED